MSEEPVLPIQIKGLCNSFGRHIVHKDLNLDVESGKILGIVGGSGAGKTVLLKTILGLNKPTSGDIKVFGVNMFKATAAEQKWVMAKWGVLFQSGALFSSLSVIENICVPLIEFTKLNSSEARRVALLKMMLAGLPMRAADLKPSELSGGMIKRAALARALALDPELIFLDEPTSGLDPIGAAAFDLLIKELAQNLGLSVFMITHDLDSLYTCCDEVAVLADYHVVAKTTTKALEKFDHPWVHDYFNGPRSRIKTYADVP